MAREHQIETATMAGMHGRRSHEAMIERLGQLKRSVTACDACRRGRATVITSDVVICKNCHRRLTGMTTSERKLALMDIRMRKAAR
jgi:ribosomal protein L37AE/L43A